ncbi:hypothetical protein ACFVZD_32135 [Streptomyces sp. NPDC058287]|uniref:hypothetical protein n=1 Tax=unclassified Streptomyces TaxID=2593676 RepID=UPI0036E07D2E
MQGWWAELASAEREFTSRIGSHFTITEASVMLSERSGDDNYEAQKRWPDDQVYRPPLSVRAFRLTLIYPFCARTSAPNRVKVSPRGRGRGVHGPALLGIHTRSRALSARSPRRSPRMLPPTSA